MRFFKRNRVEKFTPTNALVRMDLNSKRDAHAQQIERLEEIRQQVDNELNEQRNAYAAYDAAIKTLVDAENARIDASLAELANDWPYEAPVGRFAPHGDIRLQNDIPDAEPVGPWSDLEMRKYEHYRKFAEI